MLEKRRRRAVELLRLGKTYRWIAAKVGASLSSVVRWQQAYQRQGSPGLVAKPMRGRPPRLSPKDRDKLLQLLVQGPAAAGYSTDLWTLPRIAKLIRDQFGVRYSLSNVWYLMGALEWSCQKPERRATQRDEAAIARWKRCQWPRIKKSPKTGGPSRIPR